MANYQYPKAGKKAPAGVRQSIAKFKRLPVVQKQRTPLLYFLLGSGTDDYKMDPVDANYVNITGVPQQNCGNCSRSFMHVKGQRFICDQISGYIRPEGWCRLWVG